MAYTQPLFVYFRSYFIGDSMLNHSSTVKDDPASVLSQRQDFSKIIFYVKIFLIQWILLLASGIVALLFIGDVIQGNYALLLNTNAFILLITNSWMVKTSFE